MWKKILITALGLIVVVGSLVGVKAMQFKAMSAQASNAGPPPESVAVSEVKEVTWRPRLDAVGSVVAVQGVTLTAEVPGTVRRIAFESGALVQAGDVLLELDGATERAQLAAADASGKLAQTNLKSGQSLQKQGAIADTQFASLEAQSKQADAENTRLRSIIGKKTIRAPFTGRVGLRQINLGQFVGSGDVLLSLQSLDPVYVDFSLPQQRLSELQVGLEVMVTTDAYPNSDYVGKLSAIQPEVDPVTRSVRMRATFENPQNELRPGMFVRAQVVLPRDEKLLVVPATAIMYAPYGDSVYVVEQAKSDKPDEKPAEKPGLVAQQKFVRLGATRGDYVAIVKGLKPGEQVVVTGAFKLRNGSSVTINNELLPAASERPKPNDT
ncbi:MAG TPA: efflux RND transporter periplasmic adaptor subunit [Polyangiales bacterium]|nr:efflux RND transporter periplasmic adaptor subunit [Polyangiales bacterium]